jgi:hypothetical protein
MLGVVIQVGGDTRGNIRCTRNDSGVVVERDNVKQLEISGERWGEFTRSCAHDSSYTVEQLKERIEGFFADEFSHYGVKPADFSTVLCSSYIIGRASSGL